MINFSLIRLFKHLLGKSSLQKNILKISYGKFKKEFVKGIFFAGINIQEIMTNFAKLA